MNPHQLLQALFNATEMALLNGKDRDMVRECAKQLATWIDSQQIKTAPPAPTTNNETDNRRSP
jgi:hypothetical protein